MKPLPNLSIIAINPILLRLVLPVLAVGMAKLLRLMGGVFSIILAPPV